jgi:hypothetical protein
MAQVDSENSTALPADPTRRRFLSNAAGVAAGGTVLALATIPPAPAAVALTGAAAKPEAIFGLIEDHRTAIVSEDVAWRYYSRLEEAIPAEQRRGSTIFRWEVTEVATDDPRWTAACHACGDAALKADQIAIDMLDAPISSAEGLGALMSYAGEHIAAGHLWPRDLEGDRIAGREGCLCDWETALLVKAASTMRQLNAVTS